MISKKIAIIGLGWVGQPLAKQLMAQNHQVIGTTRTPEKAKQLSEQGISPELLMLSDGQFDRSSLNIEHYDTVVIALTPGFKRSQTDYIDNVTSIVSHAQQQQVKQIILLSSTGVYSALNGELTEQSTINTRNDKARQLQQAEQSVLQFDGHSQVLRLAGLVGPKRYPGKFLAGKTELSGAHELVHLIHQQDVINIVMAFIHQPEVTGIYNCVSPVKTTRKNFYQKAALNKQLVAPEFLKQGEGEENIEDQKVILGDKLQQNLNYQFVYPNLYDWLDAEEQ